MKNGNEKLDQLLRQFMDAPHAHELEQELSYADALFEKYPVRPLEPKAMDAVTGRVHRTLTRRRHWAAAKWYTAVAAVIAAALTAGLYILYPAGPAPQPGGTAPIKLVLAGQDRLWTDALYAFFTETDPIERELTELSESIQSENSSGTYGPVKTINSDLLEIEEIESLAENAAFRKG